MLHSVRQPYFVFFEHVKSYRLSLLPFLAVNEFLFTRREVQRLTTPPIPSVAEGQKILYRSVYFYLCLFIFIYLICISFIFTLSYLFFIFIVSWFLFIYLIFFSNPRGFIYLSWFLLIYLFFFFNSRGFVYLSYLYHFFVHLSYFFNPISISYIFFHPFLFFSPIRVALTWHTSRLF